MTTIVISKDNNQSYKGFTCMGHAEFAKKKLFGGYEPDILCSAISAIVLNTLNSLEELAGEQMDVVTNEETGFIKCDFKSKLQDKSIFLLDSMVFGLENLSKEYGTQYLQVKFEEV